MRFLDRFTPNSLRTKLTGASALVALAIAGFVAWALAMDQQSIERAAQLEAEHVARTLVPPGMGDAIH
ncbi:MAG TPA: hypothetical protein VH278_00575, partial [Burkholderiaceae bacterium]|nr:hypothetical protein [Burkholderiaceae bacterium]